MLDIKHTDTLMHVHICNPFQCNCLVYIIKTISGLVSYLYLCTHKDLDHD